MAEELEKVGTPLDLERFAVDPSQEGWAKKVKEIFDREGFVVVRSVLDAVERAEVLEACRRTEEAMLKYDPNLIGCRDQGRYSFGAASKSGHMLHVDGWVHLLGAEKVLDAVDAIYGGAGKWHYTGGGGDFVRGKTLKFQGLHSDLGPARVPKHMQNSLPAPKIGVNFALEDVTSRNGPMRIVPRRKVLNNKMLPPEFLDEPPPENLGTVALQPLSAGDVIIRDLRTWHSGTPNLATVTRFLPNTELCSDQYAGYLDDADHTFSQSWCSVCNNVKCALPAKERAKSLCPDVFSKLSSRCQRYCTRILANRPGDIPRGVRPNFANLQETWKKGKGKGKGQKTQLVIDERTNNGGGKGKSQKRSAPGENIGIQHYSAEGKTSPRTDAEGQYSGTMARYGGRKKFGFISQDGDETEMFILPGSCEAFGGELPEIGIRVVYHIVTDPKTGKPRAEDVHPAEDDFGSGHRSARKKSKRWR